MVGEEEQEGEEGQEEGKMRDSWWGDDGGDWSEVDLDGAVRNLLIVLLVICGIGVALRWYQGG